MEQEQRILHRVSRLLLFRVPCFGFYVYVKASFKKHYGGSLIVKTINKMMGNTLYRANYVGRDRR